MTIENGPKMEKINPSIEKATLEDLPAIQKLTKELFNSEIKNGFDDNIEPEWSYSQDGKEELENRIKSKESVGLISKVNNEAIGYLIGLILEEETGRIDSKYAELEHMFVAPDFRGEKIGEKLVEEFKAWGKENKLKRIKTNVSFKNEMAISFYKKVGLIPADVKMSGEIE